MGYVGRSPGYVCPQFLLQGCAFSQRFSILEMKTNISNWRWFFLLAALEAGAALLALFLVPHEGSSFSLTRLALFGILIAFFVLWIFFFAHPPKRFDFL